MVRLLFSFVCIIFHKANSKLIKGCNKGSESPPPFFGCMSAAFKPHPLLSLSVSA